MLFTPAYHAHTDTAAGGLEWVLDGNPLRVRGKPVSARQDADSKEWIRPVVRREPSAATALER